MEKPKVHKAHLTKIQKLFPKVTTITDATESLTVEVRARDNRRGTPKHPSDCAMARACKRELGLDGAVISLSKAYLIRGSVATRYIVPPSLSKEVVVFDRSHSFEPGTYQLSKVPATRRIGRGGGGEHSDGSGDKPKKPVVKVIRHLTTGVRNFYDRPGTEQEEE